MKTSLKSIFMVALSLAIMHIYGQESFSTRTAKKTTNLSGTSVAIALKNLSQRPVIIFAGPKEELTKPGPRQKVYEALSTNTIYVSTNEVVCIMHESGKPVACADVMAGTAEMEIDESGSIITLK